jgi:hypothetical protein
VVHILAAGRSREHPQKPPQFVTQFKTAMLGFG